MMEHSYQFNPKAQIICFKNIEYEYHEMDFKSELHMVQFRVEYYLMEKKIILVTYLNVKTMWNLRDIQMELNLNSPSLEDIIAKITGDSNE